MKTVHVKSLRGEYRILIGQNLLAKVGDFLRALHFKGKVLVISQDPIAGYHLGTLTESLGRQKIEHHVHRIPDGEIAKCEKELFGIYQALINHDFERRDMILALGGGVVGDLSGFAAATYLRGIRYVQCGTTLLAQVDSSIGGKTAIDLPQGKNLAGAFYPPQLVISDINVLATLPAREFHASLAEAVKYGVIRDAGFFSYLEKRAKNILGLDPKDLMRLVYVSSSIKAGVVSRDEFETGGERMILNLGHTFGHAIEKSLYYRKLVHGEAVAIGMVQAARLAVHLNLMEKREERRLEQLLLQFHLPVSLSGLDLETQEILSAMGRDKKKSGGRLRFVLPVKIGKVVIREDVPEALVRKTVQELGGK